MLEVRRYKQAAYVEATKVAYKCHLKSYMSFCCNFSRTPIPASQQTIVAYATYLARRMVPASIPVYLNVIRILHLESGFKNPLTGNWASLNAESVGLMADHPSRNFPSP